MYSRLLRENPRHIRKLIPKVAGKSGDDLGTPAGVLLAFHDRLPDRQVELDEIAVDRTDGAPLGVAYVCLEAFEHLPVVIGDRDL